MICKKCNLEKGKEFYSNDRTCKDCRKELARQRISVKKRDPEWVKKERERTRKKYHRLSYRDKYKPSLENKKKAIEKYKKKYPEKIKARNSVESITCKKGCNLHHWSYNKEHYKDVIELSTDEHYKLHRFIKYDKKTFMYKTLNGVLLDTKEKHLDYYNNIKNL